MKLYEFEGCELFKNEGIPVPNSVLASTPEEAREKAKQLTLPVVVKAQVLSGGRGLAGGVKSASSLEEVQELTRQILELKIGGYPVQQVMIGKKVEIEKEFYAGIAVDDYLGTPVAILSIEGGVSINKAVSEHPESVASRPISITDGLTSVDARRMCRSLGLRNTDLSQISDILCALYKVFRKYDAVIAEINPLARTPEGKYVAIDSKVEIDDSSLYRHTDLKLDITNRIVNPLERKGREIGVSYVELDGDIAVIASGAGLGMASIDFINRIGMHPANFLETGGGITEELLYKIMGLVMQKKGIRAVFVNVYGGINPIHEGAKGIVRYMRDHGVTIPVVAKALGNHQEETWEILRQGGVHVVSDISTEKAITELASLLEGKQ